MLAQLASRHFPQLSALKSGISLVKNPTDLREVLNISDRLLELASAEDIKKFSEELCTNPQAIRAIEDRYRVRGLDLKRLSKCKKGTLGRSYSDFLAKNQISPESLSPPPIKDDVTYVIGHLYETHDIWHTVTGFETTTVGELGLAAFGAAQLPSQFEYLLLAGGILNTVFYQFDERDERMDSIVQGWQMGKKAKPFFGIQWDKLWNEPLAKVRKDLGIKRLMT